MKAISLTNPKQIELIDIPEPAIGAEDVLVDVQFIGLCGTDLNSYRGKLALVSYPRIPGHEISGVIVEKGAKVKIDKAAISYEAVASEQEIAAKS